MPQKPSCEELEERVRQLEEENSAYRRLAENLNDVLYILDDRARITYISPNVERLSGYRPEDLIGRSFTELVHPEDLEGRMEEFREILSGRERTVEYRYVSKSGKSIPILSNSRPVFRDGNAAGIQGVLVDITQRKKAEEDLKQSEERFALAMEASKDGIWDWNIETGMVYYSPGYTRMLGYESTGGLHPYDFWINSVHPEDRDAAIQANMDCIENRSEGFEAEFRMQTKAGKWIWILGRGKVVSRDEQGRARRMVGTHTEITRQKQVEVALVERERHYRTLINQIQAAVIVHGPDTRILSCNHKAQELLGLTEDQMLGRTAMDPDWRFLNAEGEFVPAGNYPVNRVLQTRKPLKDFVAGISHAGKPDVTWVLVNAEPVFDIDGAVEQVIVTFIDITDSKRTEEALVDSEKQKNLILNATTEMVTYFDPDLRIVWSNRAAAEAVGSSPEAMAGRHCHELWPGRSEPCPGCPVLKAKDTRIPQQAEMQTPDGRHWAIRGYPVINAEGGIAGLVEFTQEITDRKQAELMSAKLREQFHQAQKMESIGRLAGGVAHDLNNLLSPILGYGEMLIEDAAPTDPRREPLEEIVKAGKRAQEMVRQLLAFSRKQPLRFRPVYINSLLKDFKKLLRRTLREDIKIVTHLGRSLPPVRGDIGQLEQVIMNIAVNAQDAMPGGGTLTMETSRVDLDEDYAGQKNGVVPGPYIMLAISDDGSGMDAVASEHLFEPFFTTKEPGKGTGLGMSTAYGIIKQHGGNIWAYSEPGRGTTIKVYLPVPAEPLEAAEASPRGMEDAHGVETILLAEDDQQVRALAAAVLERYGYRVLAAGSGREALSALEAREGPIHLLLTDVIMPDMNGKELFNKVSQIHPNIRVLYMSGYTDNVIAHHGVIDPGVNFIEKPFTVKALSAKVREALDK